MAFVPIANACAVELRFTYNAIRCEYTLGFVRSAPFTAANIQALCDLLEEWWYATGRALHMNSVVHVEAYGRALDSETAPTYTSVTRAGTVGTASASGALPHNVAFAVSFRTALRGRANRGRNYMFGLYSGFHTGPGYVTAAYRNSVIAHYQTLLPGGSKDPTPAQWCVLSRQLNNVVGGRAVPITNVTVANDALDSMRKRLPGRGI